MKIKILDKFSYQAYPITDDMIEVNEEILKEIGKTKCFDNGKIVDYDNSTETTKEETKFKIIQLTNSLEKTDYIANKLIEAETEEERQELRFQYATQLANRKQWRKEISDLQDKLKTLEQEV